MKSNILKKVRSENITTLYSLTYHLRKQYGALNNTSTKEKPNESRYKSQNIAKTGD